MSVSTFSGRIAAGLLAGAIGLSFATSVLAETTIRLGHVLADSHSWHIAATSFISGIHVFGCQAGYLLMSGRR